MSRPLRIVHCFRSPVGGIFRHVRDLAQFHSAEGHLVGMICDSSTGGELEERYFDEIAPRLPLGIRRLRMQRQIGPGDVTSAIATYRAIKELKPDILHGHGAKGGAFARVFGSLLRVSGFRVARLYSPHGGVLHYARGEIKNRAMFALERGLERMTDHLLFVSDHERRTYIEKIGRPRVPATLVYNGLRQEEFVDVAPVPEAADFLYIGMMRDLKGPDIFIDALAAAAKATGRPLTAVMVGDGDDLLAYRAQVERLGLGAQVSFHPAMPARQAFALGRTIVVPSRAEAMPYIVLEALAAGKTMLASAVGGIPEVLGQGSPALVQPDAGELAARMVELLSDEAAFARHMPSKQELRARFGADVMATSVGAIYQSLVAGNRTSG